MHELFCQEPPQLGNQFDDDRMLRGLLRRRLAPDAYASIAPTLRELGALAGGELYRFQLADRLNEPRLTQWNAWGERIDQIDVSPLWERARLLTAQYGVVAAAYDGPFGAHNRLVQFALAYLFHPSTDVYTCPLAMTDGAARTLLHSGNPALIERAVPRLTSRNPAQSWTSGQWMTEATGGSDVGRSETVARRDAQGQWRLYGRKWFTSATTSEMALTLARPEDGAPGGRGLALFYVETRDTKGRLRNIEVNRLKDKLGTRKVPTAELLLNGTPATPVGALSGGVAAIVPMLHITRTWNSVMSVATMRRGMALAADYATRRVAFGRPLSAQPLHIATLADAQAETEAAFHLSFFVVELLGLQEAEQATPEQRTLLRFLTSLAKLCTGRQAVDVLSEVIEAFGGAGYVEDTGLPLLLRDAHVLPIWEGTTNVLALDTLRAIGDDGAALQTLGAYVAALLEQPLDTRLQTLAAQARQTLAAAGAWLQQQPDGAVVQAGQRRWALTVSRATALALLVDHAQWALATEQDTRPLVAAQRFARRGISQLDQFETAAGLEEAAALFGAVEPVAD